MNGSGERGVVLASPKTSNRNPRRTSRVFDFTRLRLRHVVDQAEDAAADAERFGEVVQIYPDLRRHLAHDIAPEVGVVDGVGAITRLNAAGRDAPLMARPYDRRQRGADVLHLVGDEVGRPAAVALIDLILQFIGQGESGSTGSKPSKSGGISVWMSSRWA